MPDPPLRETHDNYLRLAVTQVTWSPDGLMDPLQLLPPRD